MKPTITINLSEDIELALEEATREDGVSKNELINQAISDFLFVRKFRLLRESLIKQSETSYSDQDIFEIVS